MRSVFAVLFGNTRRVTRDARRGHIIVRQTRLAEDWEGFSEAIKRLR